MEVAELDHEAALDRRDGEIVEEVDGADIAARAHRQARRLDDLLEQSVDLAGNRSPGRVGLLGELGVARAATRDRRHQRLVVAQAEADRRASHAGAAAARRDPFELGVIGDADVRVTVGEQQQRRAVLALHAPGLLDPAQQPAREVGRRPRVEPADQPADGVLVAQGAGPVSYTHLTLPTTPYV